VSSKVLKNKLLVGKEKYGNTGWDRVAQCGPAEAFLLLLNCVKEGQINSDELMSDDDSSFAAFEMGYIEVTDKLLV
jgi:hypothetical protein